MSSSRTASAALCMCAKVISSQQRQQQQDHMPRGERWEGGAVEVQGPSFANCMLAACCYLCCCRSLVHPPPHILTRWNLDSQLPQPVRFGTDAAADAAATCGTECLRAYLRQQLAAGAHLLLVTRPAGSCESSDSGGIAEPAALVGS